MSPCMIFYRIIDVEYFSIHIIFLSIRILMCTSNDIISWHGLIIQGRISRFFKFLSESKFRSERTKNTFPDRPQDFSIQKTCIIKL